MEKLSLALNVVVVVSGAFVCASGDRPLDLLIGALLMGSGVMNGAAALMRMRAARMRPG